MKQVLVALSDKHKQAIKKIGFGAFLKLDAPHYADSWSTKQFLTNFDPKKCCLMLPRREEEILFDEIDVHMTYGLPMGDIAILDTIENKNECANFMQKWRKNFNLKVGASTNAQLISRIQKVKEVDKEQKQVSDEFIWNFLVCVVNSCIRSTNSNQIYVKFLYSCKDTKNIVKLDWCKFVKEHLMETTKKMARWRIFLHGSFNLSYGILF